MAEGDKSLDFPSLSSRFEAKDTRQDFDEATGRTPLPQGAESAFVASRLQLLRTQPVPPDARQSMVDGYLDSIRNRVSVLETRPTPGGVGYGMYYAPGFRTAFQTGTGIAWGIVCPIPPGGNVSDWLYLTATNRSSMGVEAFIAYHGQTDVTFNVFDWARNPMWQIHRPVSTMADYIGSIVANGVRFPVVQVMNVTYQGDATSWVNEVHVLNQVTGIPDLAYQYAYAATYEQQIMTGRGTWAPIVETSQPAYARTNPMGCSNTKMASRDVDGTWSPMEFC